MTSYSDLYDRGKVESPPTLPSFLPSPVYIKENFITSPFVILFSLPLPSLHQFSLLYTLPFCSLSPLSLLYFFLPLLYILFPFSNSPYSSLPSLSLLYLPFLFSTFPFSSLPSLSLLYLLFPSSASPFSSPFPSLPSLSLLSLPDPLPFSFFTSHFSSLTPYPFSASTFPSPFPSLPRHSLLYLIYLLSSILVRNTRIRRFSALLKTQLHNIYQVAMCLCY